MYYLHIDIASEYIHWNQEHGSNSIIAKLSQVPAKLDWDRFIITIPVVRVCVRHPE